MLAPSHERERVAEKPASTACKLVSGGATSNRRGVSALVWAVGMICKFASAIC